MSEPVIERAIEWVRAADGTGTVRFRVPNSDEEPIEVVGWDLKLKIEGLCGEVVRIKGGKL